MQCPNLDAHALRSIYRDLSLEVSVDNEGFAADVPFPSLWGNPKFALEYFAHNVGRKRESDNSSVQAMKASIGKWVDSEHSCRVVNLHGRYYSALGEDVELFSSLQRRTGSILSQVLCDVWPDLSGLQFTGGATSTSRRRYCNPSVKRSGTPDPRSTAKSNLACVNGASDLLSYILETSEQWLGAELSLRYKTDDPASAVVKEDVGVVITHVPKDRESVRIIGKTGGLTIAIQKLFGDAIRRTLKQRCNIDLNDQVPNQEWAEIGSLTNLVATVDLSSASDSIAKRHLSYFPPRWQEYFLATRDKHVVCGETTHQLEKVALMGNGFIFELQTLLYYAFTKAVCEEMGEDTSMISVYGDDIICPRRAYPMLERFLTWNGFQLNATKSFHEAHGFRESCGKHYYHGQDVTPVYFKRTLLKRVSERVHLYNELAAWSERTGHELKGSLRLIGGAIPPKFRNYVPVEFGTKAGLHYPIPGGKPPVKRWSRDLQRYTYRYTVIKDKVVDEMDRYPDWVRLYASLSALDAGKPVTEVNAWFDLWPCWVPHVYTRATIPRGLDTDTLTTIWH